MTDQPRAFSFAEIFNRAAARDYASFPDKLKNLAIKSTQDEVYVSPAAADFRTANPEQFRSLAKQVDDMLALQDMIGLTGMEEIAGEQFNFITFDFGKAGAYFKNEKLSAIMDLMWVFDHEIGHIVVNEGSDNDNHLSECAADAYAALRHLQRFGDTHELFDTAIADSAARIVWQGIAMNYTSAAIQRVIDLHRSGTIDIKKLSPQETAKLAGEIAREHMCSDQELGRVQFAYSMALGDAGDDTRKMIRATVNTMEKYKNEPDILRAGRLCLSHGVQKDEMDEMAAKDPAFRAQVDALFNQAQETNIQKKLEP